jgi:hypothetical protein
MLLGVTEIKLRWEISEKKEVRGGHDLTYPDCQVLNEMSKEICLGGVSEGPDWFIKVD